VRNQRQHCPSRRRIEVALDAREGGALAHRIHESLVGLESSPRSMPGRGVAWVSRPWQRRTHAAHCARCRWARPCAARGTTRQASPGQALPPVSSNRRPQVPDHRPAASARAWRAPATAWRR
jgi:hypothetical protein